MLQEVTQYGSGSAMGKKGRKRNKEKKKEAKIYEELETKKF